jgi:hypothetical protein
VWIATDPDHAARAVLLARLALGGRGLAVAPAPPPPPSTLERRKLLRDALRLTPWRAIGSTGGWLVPEQVARKRVAWGGGVGGGAANAAFRPRESRLIAVPAAGREGSLGLGAVSGRWARSWFRRGALAAARVSTT